jgi:putative oxidoreductase
MSDTGITSGTRAAPAASGRHAVNIFALWVLQVVLAIMFAMAGFAKVGSDQAMVQMFATIGIGQWFRYLLGALEIAGALGVLVPRLSGLAALGLLCLMAGATLTNVFVLHTSPLVPIVLMVVSALVAWGRWPRTRTLFTNGEARRLR